MHTAKKVSSLRVYFLFTQPTYLCVQVFLLLAPLLSSYSAHRPCVVMVPHTLKLLFSPRKLYEYKTSMDHPKHS